MPPSSQRQPRVTPAAGRGNQRKQTAEREDRERPDAAGESSEPAARGRRVNADGPGIEISILDRKLRIACAEAEQQDLLRAVHYVDTKMREIRGRGKAIGSERIAILAALNIAHELLSTALGSGFDTVELKRRMQSMAAVIDEAMSAQEDLF